MLLFSSSLFDNFYSAKNFRNILAVTVESQIIGGVGILGGGGGLDIVIIINSRGVGIIGGLDGVEKIV